LRRLWRDLIGEKYGLPPLMGVTLVLLATMLGWGYGLFEGQARNPSLQLEAF
jgi:hypothetical protein